MGAQVHRVHRQTEGKIFSFNPKNICKISLLPVRRDYGGGGAGAGPGVVPTLRGHGVRAAVRRSCKYFP